MDMALEMLPVSGLYAEMDMALETLPVSGMYAEMDMALKTCVDARVQWKSLGNDRHMLRKKLLHSHVRERYEPSIQHQ
jgi:hypothetical protein